MNKPKKFSYYDWQACKRYIIEKYSISTEDWKRFNDRFVEIYNKNIFQNCFLCISNEMFDVEEDKIVKKILLYWLTEFGDEKTGEVLLNYWW